MKRLPIVAIDGPAGAGKSTVTKAFAKQLGLIYLDTGAMYRAVTWLIQKNDINPENQNELNSILKDCKLDLQTKLDGDQAVIINGIDVTELIRSPKVTSTVSIVAAQKIVREILTNQQKKIGSNGGIVAEGRDIGSTVFPEAEMKVFLTATPKERAKRRAIDLKKKGFLVPDLIKLENEINQRDQLDSNRTIAPLIKTKDAIELISDGMSIQDVIEELVEIFRRKIPEEVWPTPQK